MGGGEDAPYNRLLKLATLDIAANTFTVAGELVGCPVAWAVTETLSPVDKAFWRVIFQVPVEETVAAYGVPLFTVSEIIALACAVPLIVVDPAKSGVLTFGIAVPLTVTEVEAD